MREMHQRRQWLLALAIVGLLVVISGCEDTTESETAVYNQSSVGSTDLNLAADYVDRLTEQLRLQVENDFLHTAIADTQASDSYGLFNKDLADRLASADALSQQTVANLLDVNCRTLRRALQQDQQTAQQQSIDLARQLKEVRGQIYARQTQIFERDASRRASAQVATLVSPDNIPFLLMSLLAATSLGGIILHERRHNIRQLLNGGNSRPLRLWRVITLTMTVLFSATTLAAADNYLFHNRVYHWLLVVGADGTRSPRQEIDNEIHALSTSIERQRNAAAQQTSRYRHVRALARKNIDTSLGADSSLLVEYQQIDEILCELAICLGQQEHFVAKLGTDSKRLEELHATFAAVAADTTAYQERQKWIRGSTGLAVLLLTGGMGIIFRRNLQNQRDVTRKTCPMCLGYDTLKPVTSDSTSAASADSPLQILECRNVMRQFNEYGEDEAEDCGFKSMAVYQSMPKMCFPTLGIPQAGKTAWLAMAYRELNRGNFPRGIHFDRIKTESSEQFDRIVDDILNSKLDPERTQTARLPHPLVFNFRDRDPWGRSYVLLNMFDYSGEVTRGSRSNLTDLHRQRALQADGYIFLLDPTRPSEAQAKALVDFREDLRLVKGARPGQDIRVPAAICITKLDLLVNQSYASPGGGDAIEQFYQDLREVDPSGEEMNLTTLKSRSILVAKLRDTIWPGWEIERQIDDLFGGRYMFFPMAPFGLEDLGVTELREKTITPFGILEPFLWLLHMNGFPVLDS